MTSILRLLDGKRAKIVEQNDLEIVHVHETVRKLQKEEQIRCFDFAAQVLRPYRVLVGESLYMGDVVWTFERNTGDDILQRAYEINLTGSEHFQSKHDIALWAVPTFIQFCLDCEIVGREMRSDAGRAFADAVGRVASDKVGLLAMRQLLPRTLGGIKRY